jgi:pyrimidine operon attenuation protein/uracil phosphoribosyltransferase
MASSITQVLSNQQVKHKISRIAWQIYEEHHNRSKVVLAGIAQRGFLLAKLLQTELAEISSLKIELLTIQLDKRNPLFKPIKVTPEKENFDNESIIVIDDVLNSGATLIYGVRYFLNYSVQSIHTVVLVDRSHKRYPIKADFKGLSLSTALQEHVKVNIAAEPYSVTVS